MKKRLKYTLVSLGSLVVLAGIGLEIMYMVSVFLPLSYNHGDIFACSLLFLSFQIPIHHGTDTGIRPYVFCRLYHVDDGIDWQDDAHDADRSIDTGHQR